MKPVALFVVTSDPRSSPKAVEAIRIAVGVAAWKRVDVAVYLGGPAVLTIAGQTDDLVEADNLERYTPLLRDLRVYVEPDPKFQRELSEAVVPFELLPAAAASRLAIECHYLLRF